MDLKPRRFEGKGKLIGYCIYYAAVAAIAIVGAVRGWRLRLPMLIALLILLLVSLGGDENYAATFKAYQRDPLVAQDLKPRREHFDGLKLGATLLLILPPAAYLLIDILVKGL